MKARLNSLVFIWMLIVGIGLMLVDRASGEVLTALASFNRTNGATPLAGLVQRANGNFYGTTQSGGVSNVGTIFSITPSGVLTTLYSCQSIGTNNVSSLFGTLTEASDGSYFGTGNAGGFTNAQYPSGPGAVFRITTNGVLTTYPLPGYPGGSHPHAGLVKGLNDHFYGTTKTGGNNSGGMVFDFNTNGTITTLLNQFDPNLYGQNPVSSLVLGADGFLYGTTGGSGLTSPGAVFKMTTGGVITLLYAFSPAVSNGSALYTNSTGANPFAGLTFGNDGDLYGVTANGGGGSGTVFKVSTNGALTLVYSFPATSTNGIGISTNAAGASPQASLMLGGDGKFYGTAANGGSGGAGTVFSVTINGALTVLYSFPASATNSSGLFTNSTGANPKASLVQGKDGNFYGTTSGGGTNGFGTVFKLIGSIPLNIQPAGSRVVLSWTNSDFVLQSAPAITGNFTNIPGATNSPYTNPIVGAPKYFRLISN
jgi:uncharacterized repeat protein (TIGR03803 family)